MAHQSPSSPFFFECACTYDVFLSFKGTDTRFGFSGNLHKALSDKGINTFIDDKELQSGDEITPSLVKAIEDSRIFIPVLSINYASSSFCLDELVHMIHCSKENGRLVLPVFYDVDPSHVRHQTGSYGKAMSKHKKKFTKYKKQYTQPIHIILILFLLALALLYSHGSTITLFSSLLFLLVFFLQNAKKVYTGDMNRLEKWKIALNQTANLSGHHFNPRNKYEHEIIEKIVKQVFNKIYRARLHVANYPVGLESRVLHVKSLMDVGCDRGVYMVGIYGIGGMGKSTLARATFNFIADQFECLCFLHNIRENSDQNGLKYLQEELLSKTVGLDLMLGDVSEGIPIIKKALGQKKVLLVLDDIDKPEQLWALAGELDWFGQGSRVIITTRDKRLLSCHMIKRTCEVDGLDEEEAFELLRWMAFKTENVDSRYANVLNRAVTYASGLPLALEVVGSNLFGKCIQEWKDLLDEYEKIPNKDIHEILKVSFNNLKEMEQSVFLDIACCFKGYDLVKVQEILLAHYGCCKKHQIEVLVQKSLIKFSLFSTVTLHDLIEDMGKEIVRQESPQEPGKRSRLWFYEDIVHVLEQNTGTNRIGIIYLNFPSFEEDIVEWEGDELKNMKNLKTLIIKNGFFCKGLKHLPNSLRVLDWCKYPSVDIPSNFCPKKLSICKLSEGYLTSFELSRTLKGFLNMTELNLESCQSLTCINDVSGLPNLEKFIFQNCENLVTIHPSVGFLNKLKILNAEGCSKLRTFPPIKLASLQVLRLQYCKNLKRFPEILQVMENIEAIVLEGTSIEELSFSFQNFTGLCTLRIWGNGMLTLPSSILMLPSLSWIMVEDCIFLPIKNDKLMSPKVSSNVQNLILQNCNISDAFLSIIIKWFANLKYLDLSRNDFTILPECLVECSFLSSIVLDGCKFLKEIRGIPPILNTLSALQCESLNSSTRSMLLNKKLHEARHTNFCIPRGSEGIPKWFEHKSRGIERVPQWIENDNRGLTMSFWVRNWFPSITFFFSTKWMHNKGPIIKDLDVEFDLSVNGHACSGLKLWIHSTHVFQLNLNCGKPILDREQWIHVELEVKCTLTSRYLNDEVMKSISTEMGIHMLKEKSILAETISLINDENSQDKSLLSKDTDSNDGEGKKLNKPGKYRSKPSKTDSSIDCGVDADGDQHVQGPPSLREEKVSSMKTGLVHVARKMPKNAHAHFILGLMYQRLNQPQKAVLAYEKAEEILLRPEIEIDRAEFLSLVQIHHAQCLIVESSSENGSDKELEPHELEEILSKLKESMQSDIRQAAVWNTLGFILLKTGRVQSAISVLSSLLAIAPENYDCLGNLGIAYLQIGNLELSAKCFQELILKDQNHPAALVNYAALLLCKYASVVAGAGANASDGASEEQSMAANVAKECLLAAIKADAKSAHIWANLAYAFSISGDYRSSSKCLEKAAKLEPNCMSTRYAVASHRMKEAERSQDPTELLSCAGNEMASIIRDGDSSLVELPIAWAGLAMVHKAQHEISAAYEGEQDGLKEMEERAVSSLKQAITEDPDDVVQWHQLGLHNLCARQFKTSQKFLKAAVARDKGCSYAWSNLGVSLQLSEELSQAEEVFKRALSLATTQEAHVILSNLGILYRHQKKYQLAKAMFTKSLELKPGYAPAFNNLGLVFVAEGLLEEAKYCFEKALQSDPMLDAAKSNSIKVATMSKLCKGLSSCILKE